MFLKTSKYFCLLILLLSLGCNKKENDGDQIDYPQSIIFGRYFSPGCFENEVCVEIFNLSASGLYEDTNDNFPNPTEFYNGNYATTLTQTDFNQIELIFRNNIPKELLAMNSGNVGNSPSWNTTFYYFEYKSATIHKHWIMDGSLDGNLGIALQNFVLKMQDAVNIASN